MKLLSMIPRVAVALSSCCGWPLESGVAQSVDDSLPRVEITTPSPPPEWALWQRHLLEQLDPAARELVSRYTRPDGTLIWRDAWPGMDGSDDGYESFYNFPLYYLLGGPAEIYDLSLRLWEAVTRQFTQYGQVYHEFDGYYDWMHHGESYVNFYFFGLANPGEARVGERARRFAGLYLNEDPEADNFDPQRQLIRSPITGSRGPRLVNSAEDWVTHREVLAQYPLPYDDIPNVTNRSAWTNETQFPFILQALNQRMMRGDVPLNLTATSLILNAYAFTGDAKYRQWIEGYVGAWRQRVKDNAGILPDNIGLSGRIGENMGGRWWGGYYGWRWPHGLMNQIESTLIGGSNAYLVSGHPEYLELPRSVIQLMHRLRKVEGGRILVPHRHGDQGWYDYGPFNASYLIHLWYLSQRQEDYDLLAQLTDVSDWDSLRYRKGKGDYGHEGPWLRYLEGRFPEYPVRMLRANYEETLRRLDLIRRDRSVPAERNVHHWQERNPVVLEGLVQTMLGGPNHIYHGGLLHVRVRYFDPARKRAGIPADVAALVDQVRPDGISLQLVNLHATQAREVIVQAGGFGEHQFTSLKVQDHSAPLHSRFLRVLLKPGATGRLDLGMKRFAQPPSYSRPPM